MKSQPLETVSIEGPRGTPLVINKSDFDPAKHRLFQESVAEEAPRVKRGRGRPPVRPGVRVSSVTTHLPPEEEALLHRVAARRGVSTSALLRSIVLESGILEYSSVK